MNIRSTVRSGMNYYMSTVSAFSPPLKLTSVVDQQAGFSHIAGRQVRMQFNSLL